MRNWKSVGYSLIAFVFLIMMFMVDWLFVIGTMFFSWLGWCELMKN